VGRLSTLSFAALALERVFSLALIAVVAAVYGVSADTDTYYLALIVPAALGFSLTEAVYTSFLPYFGGAEGPTRRRLAAAVRFAIPLALVVGGGYALAVALVRPDRIGIWLAFAGLVTAQPLAGVYAAYFTAQRRYAVATMRVPFITATAFVLALVLLAFWGSITAIAVAFSVGYLLQLVLLAVLARRGPAPVGAKAPSPGIGLLGPTASVFVATLVGSQLIVLLERVLASTLPTGSVTLLVNARGFVLAAAMAAQALGSGVFPAASERFRELGRTGLAELTLTAVRLAALIAMVAAAYITICRRELIEVVLQRGEFDAADARETARLIVIMAPSLLGVSVGAVAGKALFGVGRQRFVAVVSGAGVVVYLGAALGFRELWGVEGLAAAFLVSSLVTGTALALALAVAVSLPVSAVARNWVAAPVAYATVFGLAAGGAWLALGRTTDGVPAALATLAAAGAAGLAALALALVLTRSPEYAQLRRLLRARQIDRQPQPPVGKPAEPDSLRRSHSA
jgi:putative peptidoglycan lipid II flippase